MKDGCFSFLALLLVYIRIRVADTIDASTRQESGLKTVTFFIFGSFNHKNALSIQCGFREKSYAFIYF